MAWRRQDDALRIDRHGVYSWMRLRPLDTLQKEREREREREREKERDVHIRPIKMPCRVTEMIWDFTRIHSCISIYFVCKIISKFVIR